MFSLLLSYLPVPQQRLECCCRAHRLLKLHGLLLLIMPDSSHQNKHVAMVKAWKTGVEAIGFHRWKYFKDTHLHCMAFRKSQKTRDTYSSLEKTCDLLYITQDKQITGMSLLPTEDHSESHGKKLLPTEDHSESHEFFLHLPFYS